MGTINYWKIFIQGITYERLFKNNSRSQTSKRLATKEIFEKDLNKLSKSLKDITKDFSKINSTDNFTFNTENIENANKDGK